MVKGMKHMPNLAKQTFTSAIKSHTHRSLRGQTMSFLLFRWKNKVLDMLILRSAKRAMSNSNGMGKGIRTQRKDLD